jgi:DNA replication protein DnaC
VAAAAAVLAPTFVDGGERVTADRLRSLRHVREQLPGNARGPELDLRSRTPSKLLGIVDGWHWNGPNLLILGPTRVGKTSGAALLVHLLLARAAASTGLFSPAARRIWGGCKSELDLAGLIRWQSCRDLTSTVREFPLGQGTPETIQRCQHARLLVLDDIGMTDDRGALERILNARYERRWPTITTSGLTSGELVRTLGDALVRRMSERAGLSGLIVNLFPAGPRA